MSKRKRGPSDTVVVPPGENADALVKERYLEYARLSKINQRVMQYFFRARNIDNYLHTLQMAIAKAKGQHAKDMARMEARYQGNLAELEAANGKKRVELKEVENNLERLNGVNDMLGKQKDRTDNKYKELKDSNGNMAKRVHESSVRLAQAEQELSKLQHECEMQKVENGALRNQLADTRSRKDQFDSEALTSRQHAGDCKRDFAMVTTKSNEKIGEMREKLERLIRSSSALEDILRREFGKKLQTQLFECQEAATRKKDKGLKELKLEYDVKWRAYNNKINVISDENDELRQKIVDATLELDTIRNKHRQEDSLANAEERRRLSLEAELQAREASIQRANGEDLAKIKELKALLAFKDREYESLAKIKADLDMEIKAYRLLLENEEDRLGGQGYISPSKKRKVPPTVKVSRKGSRRTSGRTPAQTKKRRSTRNQKSNRG